jgi:glyoxylase-like metal-dependent hydrolase (beta-lactamase superfamily II)
VTDDVGALNARASVRRWQMDDVTFTYVVDGFMAMLPHKFLPAIPRRYWDDRRDELDTQGRVVMSAGGLLIERGGHRVLVDAGLGSITGEFPQGVVKAGAFVRCLREVGVDPGDVEVFALTHLHIDHTGWMFSEATDGTYMPTFPNARYVLAAAEWLPLAHGERTAETPDERSVVDPLARHRQRSLIVDGSPIAPGVAALVTPGHSAGHASYVVTSSGGRRLVAFGDVFHVPAQMAHTSWGSAPDTDPAAVPGARARLLDELLMPDTFGFGTHFGDQPFGRVVRDHDGVPRWRPVPTEVLGPPPC